MAEYGLREQREQLHKKPLRRVEAGQVATYAVANGQGCWPGIAKE